MRLRQLMCLALLALTLGCSSSAPGRHDTVNPQDLLTLDGPHHLSSDVADDYFINFRDDDRLGYMRRLRQRVGDYCVSIQWRLDKYWEGDQVQQWQQKYVEVSTLDGRPVCFSASTQRLGSEWLVIGYLNGTVLELEETLAGHRRSWTMDWPENATMFEGSRLSLFATQVEIGQTDSVIVFSPFSMKTVDSKREVTAIEEVETLAGKYTAYLIDVENIFSKGSTHSSKLWSCSAGRMIKMKIDYDGKAFTTIRCSREQAPADFTPAPSIVPRPITVMASPAFIPAEAKAVTLVIAADDGVTPLSADMLPQIDRQTVAETGDNTLTVTFRDIMFDHERKIDSFPDDPDIGRLLQPTRFAQSDDPAVISAAREAVGDESVAGEAAGRIVQWVCENIEYDSSNWLSASQAIAHRKAMCGGMASLTAAMCRAVGIPARVVSGMVYLEVPIFSVLNQPVMVYPGFGFHFWNQIRIGEVWVDLDCDGYSAARVIFDIADDLSSLRFPTWADSLSIRKVDYVLESEDE